jgi:hypothetical protein
MSLSAEVYNSATTDKTMAKKLEGNIAVVTGGTEGIGLPGTTRNPYRKSIQDAGPRRTSGLSGSQRLCSN